MCIRDRAGSVFASSSNVQESTIESTSQLPPDLLESCRILHSTCCEFLKHFYINFQSGDPKKAGLVKRLNKNLKDCREKIDELLSSVKSEDNQDIASTCKAYLTHVLESLTLGVDKYNSLLTQSKNA